MCDFPEIIISEHEIIDSSIGVGVHKIRLVRYDASVCKTCPEKEKGCEGGIDVDRPILDLSELDFNDFEIIPLLIPIFNQIHQEYTNLKNEGF